MSPTDRHTPPSTLAAAHGQVAALLDTVESFTELVEKARAHDERLRDQLAQRGKSSKNSSEPPSSDPEYGYLRRICAEANTEAGVATLLPPDVQRLPG